VGKWEKGNLVDSRFGAKTPPLWPNEFLVKLLSSSAYSNVHSLIPYNAKVLEVGIFAGNNARMLKDKGFCVFGSEVNSEMVNLSLEYLAILGISDVEVREGANHNLAYPDAFFDILISINTLHYSSGEFNDLALREFGRVLKPGGFVIIETPSDKHFISKNAKRISECNYEWTAGGFRQGDILGFMDSKEQFKRKCERFFTNVEILERTESFPKLELAWWIAVAQK
jgi:ubiquinone/menaquinone biosynthesis C-methylase UbiE